MLTVPKTLVMDAPAGPAIAVAVFANVWTATCSAPTTGSVAEPLTRATRTSWNDPGVRTRGLDPR